MKTLMISILIALSLGACTSLIPKREPPPRLFTLDAPKQNVDSVKTTARLQIVAPQASPGLETERIALRKQSHEIDYFRGARWSGTLNAMVQSTLVEGFDLTTKLASVSNDLVAAKAGYNLLIEIRDFQIEYNGDMPSAHIRLIAKLIESDGETIIKTTGYEQAEPAKSNTISDMVIAMNTAYARIAGQMIRDTLMTLSSTTPPTASRNP